MTIKEKSDLVKNLCLEAGFLLVGFAKCRSLDEEKDRLDEWLHSGWHGEMDYMAKNQSVRLDPSRLVQGAKTVICLAYNYYQPDLNSDQSYKVAMYATGADYHKVLKKKLKKLWQHIQSSVDPNATARYFVDSAPILERQWAELAGLGWTGKNTLLINPRMGSYFFLAEIITDLVLEYNESVMNDHCGTCTRCIDACPTNAIDDKGYLLKANECISYFTIESKSKTEEIYKSNFQDWIFGCDICQQVCPWNKFAKPHSEELFNKKIDTRNWSKEDWKNLTDEQFTEYFSHTPMKRAGLEKLKEHMM